jgi:hypothetical protein
MEEFVKDAVKIVGDIQEEYFGRCLFLDKRITDECFAEILEFVSQFGPEELETLDALLHW